MHKIIYTAILMLTPLFVFAASPSISITPERVLQGEPILVTINAAASTTLVQKISFDGSLLKPFLYRGAVSAFVGVDLHKKPGTYSLAATLQDGTYLQKDIVIQERPQVTAPLGIPSKLGGNSATSAAKLVSTLASENASLANIRTGLKMFWKEPFHFPLATTTVTDPYGYSRQTSGYSIAHKGTDFRAPEGTPVMAINRGVVRVVKTYRDYGKTIVVDHGLGLMSFYMHLSKIYVAPGELVLPGEVIGKSGKTGYAESPHLHLSIRINNISIDPMKFFALIGK